MIEMIVARARNGVIGGGNQMLWHVPEDFRHFKKTTMGHPVVMGRKTWESIGRPLPGRKNVVITRQLDYRAEGAEMVPSLEAALGLFPDGEDVFVIGGGQIYRQALPLAERVWVTLIDREFDGDTTFPDLPEGEWKKTILSVLPPDEKRDFRVEFAVYDRIPR